MFITTPFFIFFCAGRRTKWCSGITFRVTSECVSQKIILQNWDKDFHPTAQNWDHFPTSTISLRSIYVAYSLTDVCFIFHLLKLDHQFGNNLQIANGKHLFLKNSRQNFKECLERFSTYFKRKTVDADFVFAAIILSLKKSVIRVPEFWQNVSQKIFCEMDSPV